MITKINDTQPIPRDTRQLLPSIIGKCQNLGLILDKFQPWSKFIEQRHNQGNESWNLLYRYQKRSNRNDAWQNDYYKGGAAKNIWIRDEAWLNFRPGKEQPGDAVLNPNARINPLLYKAFLRRWEKMLDSQPVENVLKLFLVSGDKLVVGLGEQNTLEMGLTLHKIFGFPIIPGSSLKGLAKTWALFNLAEVVGVPVFSNEQVMNREKKETPLQKLEALIEAPLPSSESQDFERCLKNLQMDPAIEAGIPLKTISAKDLLKFDTFSRMRKVFGYADQAGCITFWDAIAYERPEFSLEILNPHFPDYYQQGKAPQDNQSPVPVNFLTIQGNTTFLFAVSSNRDCEDIYLKVARLYLKKALTELGVGGKTSNGLGYFKE